MPYKLVLAPSFKKAYAKLEKKEQAQVENEIRQLAIDPWHPSLRVKHIRASHEFECSVNMDVRIAFKFEEGHLILLLDVDHHDALLRRRTRR